MLDYSEKFYARYAAQYAEVSHQLLQSIYIESSHPKLAQKAGFKVKFEARRGVRVVYGAALEKRSSRLAERGFESHPLRHLAKIHIEERCWSGLTGAPGERV